MRNACQRVKGMGYSRQIDEFGDADQRQVLERVGQICYKITRVCGWMVRALRD